MEMNSLNYAEIASELLKEQKTEWKQLSDNYSSLKKIKIRTFQFDGFKLKIQFNPERMVSTTARVDSESIKNRDCFLCRENRPKEQREIDYQGNFLILCNPFPIFPEHFTVIFKEHIPQRIMDKLPELIYLSRDLSEKYSVIYNGPKAGASAPDHSHFQVGTKYYMPVDNEFPQLKNEYGEIIKESDDLTVAGINDGVRKMISIESKNPEFIMNVFKTFYSIYENISGKEDEPLMNIIGLYEEDFGWRIIIFLRSRHRSSHYFAEGESKILISPATVDMGGVCVTPLGSDFNKLTKETLAEIIREVSLGKEEFDYIKSSLAQKLS